MSSPSSPPKAPLLPPTVSAEIEADARRLLIAVGMADAPSLVRGLVQSGGATLPDGPHGDGAASSADIVRRASELETLARGTVAGPLLAHPHPDAVAIALEQQLGRLGKDIGRLKERKTAELAALEGEHNPGLPGFLQRLAGPRSRLDVLALPQQLDRLSRQSRLRSLLPALDAAAGIVAHLEIFVHDTATRRAAIQELAFRVMSHLRARVDAHLDRLEQLPHGLLPQTPRYLLEAYTPREQMAGSPRIVEIVANLAGSETDPGVDLAEQVANALIAHSRLDAVLPEDLGSLVAAIHRQRGLDPVDALRRIVAHLFDRIERGPSVTVEGDGLTLRVQVAADSEQAVVASGGTRLPLARFSEPRRDRLGLLVLTTDLALEQFPSFVRASRRLADAEHEHSFRLLGYPGCVDADGPLPPDSLETKEEV